MPPPRERVEPDPVDRPGGGAAPGRPRRRLTGCLVRGCAVLVATAVLAELLFRLLVFSDAGPLRRYSLYLRQPQNFADELQDDYWKFTRVHHARPESEKTVPNFDPLVGWTGPLVTPGTYAHKHEDWIEGLRPVLLYGDSFAQCETAELDCFQGLIRRSPLAGTHGLLNYGVGGYGLDQIHLLALASVDRFAGRDPVVVVGLLVDNDLDRCALSIRGWPRPYLRAEDGALVSDGPVPEGVDAYLAEHPLRIPSYLWRYVVYGTTLLPDDLRRGLTGLTDVRRELSELGRLLVLETHQALEERGIEHFFMLFHGRGTVLGREGATWQERVILDALEEAGASWVSTRRAFMRELGGLDGAQRLDDYFITTGPGVGHYDPDGNRVAFETLLEGLHGVFEPRTGSVPSWVESFEVEGATGPVELTTELDEEFDPVGESPRIVLPFGDSAPAVLSVALPGGDTRFDARLRLLERPGAGAAELRAEVDGETVVTLRLEPGDLNQDLRLDLRGARTLAIEISGPTGGRVSLGRPRIQ